MKKALFIVSASLLPMVAAAQTPSTSNIESLIQSLSRIVGLLLPIVFALALLFFFWGLAQYILNSGDEAAQGEGRRKMIWGVVALFVMSAVWGLVRFIGTTFGIDTSTQNVNTPGVGDLPGNL